MAAIEQDRMSQSVCRKPPLNDYGKKQVQSVLLDKDFAFYELMSAANLNLLNR